MSSDDISPSSLPLQTRLREYRDGHRDGSIVAPAVISTVHEYVDIAKRILLEHRVRDFTAADVVALAAIMEQRDRLTRQSKGE